MANKKTTIVAAKGSKAVAVHQTDGEQHFVGIGNLKVIICQDGESWFAQGLDIDYAASGESLEDVKNNFQLGLKGTIDLHIKAYGHIEKFLKMAPRVTWRTLHSQGTHYYYTQVSLHEDLSKVLGYNGIDFILPAVGSAA